MKTYQETLDNFNGLLPSWFDEDYYKGIVYYLNHVRHTTKKQKLEEAFYFLSMSNEDVKKRRETPPMKNSLIKKIIKFIADFQPVLKLKTYPVESDETIEVKRFHFPLVIEVKCPTCGTLCNHDFSQEYLSYPKLNTPESIGVFCKTCQVCFDVDVTLRISLEVDERTIKVQA